MIALTSEELDIIVKVIPILGKVLASSSPSEPKILYAMGEQINGFWSMWDGPTPDLERLLNYPAPDTHVGPFYIVICKERFSLDNVQKFYRWNKEEVKWKKLKQK